MRRLFDSGLPLDQRVIGPTNRSDLARTPGLARQPFDSVEAGRSFAQERFESPLGAEASPHILNGIDIASRSPKLRSPANNRFIVRRSLQHHRQAVRRAARKVKVGSQLRSVAHWDERFLWLREHWAPRQQQDHCQARHRQHKHDSPYYYEPQIFTPRRRRETDYLSENSK